jgi:hypothetical protein
MVKKNAKFPTTSMSYVLFTRKTMNYTITNCCKDKVPVSLIIFFAKDKPRRGQN